MNSDFENDYSEKEKLLFKYFSLDHLMVQLNPITLYRMAGERAFLDKMEGPEVDSLRRCIIASNNCSVYRVSPEWDAMIELSESGV